MADLNAGLLGGQNLGALAQAASQNSDAQYQNLLNTLKTSAIGVKSGLDENELNGILQNNFDPSTGQVNQQQVIADLFKSQPQKALMMGQQFSQQKAMQQKAMMDAQEAQSKANLNNAQAGKAGADTQQTALETQGKALNQATQMFLGVNDQASFDKTVAFAESKGLPVGMFKGATYTPQLRQQILGMAVDGKAQLDHQIAQQNANSTTQNANTQAQVANQNYDINSTKNLVDIRGQDNQKSIEQMKIDAANNPNKANPELEFKTAEYNQKQGLENVKQNKELDSASNNYTNSKQTLKNYNSQLDALINHPALKNGSAWNSALSNVPGTDAKSFKALYDQVLGATNYNTITQAKQAGGGLGGATSDKDMAAAGATQGLIDGNPFAISPEELVSRLQTIKAGTADNLDQLELNIKKNNEYRNQVNKNTAPLQSPSQRAKAIVGTASNGVSLTQAQYDAIAKARGL